MLRESLLEHLGEHLLHRLLLGARRAALEVGADRLAPVRVEPPALIIEKLQSYVLAVHRHCYLA
jgi:hypothetical protein